MPTVDPLRLIHVDPAAGQAQIAAAILQPAPLRLLDAAVEQGPDWVTTRWRAPEQTLHLYRGDDRARILPGTLITEHAVQSGELLIYALRGPTQVSEGVPVLTRLRHARFRRMVRPGEELTTRVQLVDQLGPVYRLRAEVRCGAEAVLDVQLDFAATQALHDADPSTKS